MLKFFKTWTLPISMLAGAIGYFVFACYFSGAYKAVHVHFNSVSDALFDFCPAAPDLL